MRRCLTKRVFPLVAEQAIGWEVDKYYPSTAYLSAIDWLETVLNQAASPSECETVITAANQVVKVAQTLDLYNSEYNTKIKCLTDKIKLSDINERFIQLDGDIFYQSSVESDQLEKRSNNQKLTALEKKELSKALGNLQSFVGSSATPFYALLLMDGDGMGKLLGSQGQANRKVISKALANFTQQVPEIVSNHNGKLIYAGGDDVFALLPVSSAIRCAEQCRKTYAEAFPSGIRKVATISAAVQLPTKTSP